MSEVLADGAIHFVVEESDAGERVDVVLAQRGASTRSALRRWIEEGRLSIDGEPERRAKRRLRVGERVELIPAPPPPSAAEPEDLPLDILHEDAHLLVVNKPAGLVVHPAAGHPSGTLVNALLFHTRFEDGGDPMRPGIVHRLDKDTSGVMVVAKDVAAREGLIGTFQRHAIERRYEAIVVGHRLAARQCFETLHGRHPRDRKRFSSKVERGKSAITEVELVEPLHGAQRVACRLETGRTHQIRVHLSDHGSPLLGDSLYGRAPRDPRLRSAAECLGRQALHAAVLGFAHPLTGEAMRFETPPPADFQAALEALRG